MRMGMRFIVLVAVLYIGAMHPALAYLGTFFIDFDMRDRDLVCQQAIAVMKQNQGLEEASGRCIVLRPGESFGMFHTGHEIVFQFRPISGSVHEMVYDLPVTSKGITGVSFWPQMHAIGFEDDSSVPAIAAALQRQKVTAEAVYQTMSPGCKDVLVSGIAVANPLYFFQLPSDPAQLEDVIARNPVICSTHISPGYGNTSPGHWNECRGLAVVDRKPARILSWTKDTYQVAIDLDFNTGRRTGALYVRRQDARCR
jgi:hypothetical protein